MTNYTSEYIGARWDIIAYQGQDIVQEIPVTFGDPPEPFDFTGMEAVMQVKKKETDTNPLFEYSSADGDFDLVDDVFTFRLFGADTQGLKCGECYHYDIRFTTGGVSPNYLIYGTIKIVKNITPTA